MRVAAFDATNSTKARREHILNVLKEKDVRAKKIFIESICDSDKLLEDNIRKVKLSTPDYRDMDPEEAMEDFKKRRENYVKVYEPVDNMDGSYIKIINSQQYIVNSIRGYLPLKVSLWCRTQDLKDVSACPSLTDITFLCMLDCTLCHEFAHPVAQVLLNSTWTIGI